MKNIILTIFISLIHLLSTASSPDLNTAFKGGPAAFYEKVATAINYNDASVQGATIATWSVKDGMMSGIAIYNSLGYSVDSKIIDALSEIEEEWVESSEEKIFVLPFEFLTPGINIPSNEYPDHFMAPVKVIFNSPKTESLDQQQLFANGYTNSKELIKHIDDLVRDKDYESALENLNLLIRFKPFNVTFLDLRMKWNQVLGNKQAICNDLYYMNQLGYTIPLSFVNVRCKRNVWGL